jgi:hypothetical protein
MVTGLQQQPYDDCHGGTDYDEAQDQRNDKESKYHAFPCAYKARHASVRVLLRLVKC